WLKDFRKYCIWYGHFVLDKFTKEIAKRVRLTHKQANHFLREEVREVLLRAEADEHLLNERVKYCLMRATEEGTEYFYGQEAKEMMEKIEVEEDTIDLSAGFKGSTACPGKVTGAVKIVNSIEDIKKVEAGDIMLALTTYPAYLPAMKRAAAIVTEDGGITCHAAIVSREFRIPCVVGIRKITKILKDGDRIEVDATNGVIKIIK
ncbi:hypothetical protein KKA13_04570, partial [Patescibacteria group bacterium]|nr:hypothetical protein [Patescibacteria group bacterium]